MSIFNVTAVNGKGVAFLEASMMGGCQGRGEYCFNKSVAGVSLSLPPSASSVIPPPTRPVTTPYVHLIQLPKSPNREMLNSRPLGPAPILYHSDFLPSFSGGFIFTTHSDSIPFRFPLIRTFRFVQFPSHPLDNFFQSFFF